VEKARRGHAGRLRLKLALGCTLFLWAACAGTPKPRYALPDDPTATIVDLRKNGISLVRVQADGSVHMKNGSTHVDSQALLRFIIEEQRFFDIDPQALKLRVHQANSRYGGAVAVMDATTTAIEVALRDRSLTVEQHALAFSSQRYSEIDALQRLAAVERGIIRTVAIAHLGGMDSATRMLRAANAELARAFPGVAPLTMENLATAGTRRDGALVAHFRRAASATTVTAATVKLPPEGEPVVQVKSNETR